MERSIRMVGLLAIGIAVAGLGGIYLGGDVIFKPDAAGELSARLQQISILSVIIERAVEVYLSLSEQNGADRHDATSVSVNDTKRTASLAGLLLGAVVAISGVRVLNSFVSLPNIVGFDLRHILWTGVDVLITAGLIAGGSYIVHEVAETVIGAIKYVDPMRPGAARVAPEVVQPQVVQPQAAQP